MRKNYLIIILIISWVYSFGQKDNNEEKINATVDSVMNIRDFDKVAERLVANDSGNIDIIFARTVGLSERKRGLEAIVMLDKLLNIRQGDFRLLTLKSMAVYSLSTEDKISYYSKEIKNNPHNSSNHLSLAQAYSEKKKLKKALIHFDKAVEFSPNDEYYVYERARYKYKLGKTAEACNDMHTLKLFEAKKFIEMNCG